MPASKQSLRSAKNDQTKCRKAAKEAQELLNEIGIKAKRADVHKLLKEVAAKMLEIESDCDVWEKATMHAETRASVRDRKLRDVREEASKKTNELQAAEQDNIRRLEEEKSEQLRRLEVENNAEIRRLEEENQGAIRDLERRCADKTRLLAREQASVEALRKDLAESEQLRIRYRTERNEAYEVQNGGIEEYNELMDERNEYASRIKTLQEKLEQKRAEICDLKDNADEQGQENAECLRGSEDLPATIWFGRADVFVQSPTQDDHACALARQQVMADLVLDNLGHGLPAMIALNHGRVRTQPARCCDGIMDLKETQLALVMAEQRNKANTS